MRRGFLLSFVLSVALPAVGLADATPVAVLETALAPDLLPQVIVGDGPNSTEAFTCSPQYVNQLMYLTFVNQKGFELLDDLHTTAHGYEPLCVYEIGFYNLSGNETSAYITIYDNDAADGAPGRVLAGPFEINGLPIGLVRAQYLAPSGVIDEDVWMGVKFGAFKGCGLTLADPVLLGLSHDLAYDPRVGYVNLGPGGLPANFVLSVTTQQPVPSQTNTWGFLKASYR
jgi:hypothetical protein